RAGGPAPAACMVARSATSSWPASVAIAAASRWSSEVAVTGGDASGGGLPRVGSGHGTGRGETGAVAETPERPFRPWVAALADLAVLVVFVAVGRRSHHEDAGVAGFLRVRWPFAVA